MVRTGLVVAVSALALSLGTCQKVKMKLGIGEVVTNPEPGTPEAVVQEVLRAALNPDEEAGWEHFVKFLHSEELDSPVAMNHWRNLKFPALCKKAIHLVQDPASVTFVIMDRREEPPSLILMVKNAKSELPTPCKLRQDPSAGNAWKVFGSCF